VRAWPFVVAGVAGIGAALFFSRRAQAAPIPGAAPFPDAAPFPEYSTVTGPRGIRNNNPGNIREGEGDTTRWQGERVTDDDAAFEEFNTPEDGIRAIAVIIKNYRRLYGIETLSAIVTRWAPGHENDVPAYIESVSRRSGLVPFQVIGDAELPRLIEAMIQHENGVQPYTFAQIEEGVNRA
jgi:hypothetical protein